MFFRFATVVAVLVGIALAGVSIEKRCLALRRSISLQEYRRERLIDQRQRLHLQVDQLTAIQRFVGPADLPASPGRTATTPAARSERRSPP